MKVLIIAFGHPDNVLSLSHYLSKKVDLTVLFVVSAKHFQEGILDIRLMNSDPLIITNKKRVKEIFPLNITDFVGDDFRLWVYNQKSRKIKNVKNIIDIIKLYFFLKKENFDIIHYNGISGFIYPLYLLNRGKKQFWTLHDYKPHSGEESNIVEKISKFLAKRKKLLVVQHYEYLRGQVINYYPLPSNKVKLLRSGPLDVLKTFKPKFLVKGSYILFFGRISKYKGIDVLLESYNAILHPTMKLVVAGRGVFDFDTTPYKNNPNIIFINRYIKSEELVGLIKRSKLVVTPYKDATHSAVIMSAFVFNKPIVTSALKGIIEVVEDGYTGIYFTNSNPVKELNEVLENIMGNEKQLEKLSLNIEKEKKDGIISWNTIIENYVEVYKGNQ